MDAVNKFIQRNYRRTLDIVITAEYSKALCLTWHGLVMQFSKYVSIRIQSRHHGELWWAWSPQTKLQASYVKCETLHINGFFVKF